MKSRKVVIYLGGFIGAAGLVLLGYIFGFLIPAWSIWLGLYTWGMGRMAGPPETWGTALTLLTIGTSGIVGFGLIWMALSFLLAKVVGVDLSD